jgi:hypothetical protein
MTPSPDDVAPLINYLASEEAAKINGKIFNVGGPIISLYSEPEISKTLVKYGGRWTIDELRQQLPFWLSPPV